MAVSLVVGWDGAWAQPDRKLADALQAISTAIDAHDCTKIVKLSEPLLATRRGKLPASLEMALDSAVAACALEMGAKDKGYAYALQGTRFDDSPDELWHQRLVLEIEAKKYAPAVATVEAMTQGRGAALNSAPMAWFYRLSGDLKEAGLKSERKRLLKALAADSYAPVESSGDAQGLHFDYAALLAEEGDAAGARRVLDGVTDPMLLLQAAYDAHLRAVVPANLDLRGAAEKALALDRAILDRHPDRIDPVLNVAADLRRLGRADEALSLLQQASSRLSESDGFSDREDKLPWYWNSLGQTYLALGRYDDAVKAYSTGGASKEVGGLNVSQVLNLAGVQLRFGHPEDTLKTLAAFDDPARKGSPYGEMVLHYIRGCARALTGRRAEAAADLAYAEAHPKDHPSGLGYLYLCLDRPDDAARFYVARLDDPATRGATLRELSDFDPPRAAVPPELGGRVERFKARADVKAALARAGGLRHIPLQEEL